MTSWIRRAFGRPSSILVAIEQWKTEQAALDRDLPVEIGAAHQLQVAWVAARIVEACAGLDTVIPPVLLTVVAGGYYAGSPSSERGWYRVEYTRPEAP